MVQLEVKGLDGLIKKFDQLAKETQVGVNAALEDWANRTAQDAKQLVSANSSDEGALLRSISPSHGNGYAKVVATAKYAAYIEFGTRKFAASYVSTLPSDWAAYAATFKGSAGHLKRCFYLLWHGVKEKELMIRRLIQSREVYL